MNCDCLARRLDGEGTLIHWISLLVAERGYQGLEGEFIHLRHLLSTVELADFFFLSNVSYHRSNDYSSNDCKSSLKAMLLNKVIVGKGCKMLHDNTSLQAPPAGFDSVRRASLSCSLFLSMRQVLAEKGGSLNYDELVVYTNDAIRPSFLVMYEP